MPRYYFHIFDGEDVIDEEGMDLPDDAAARLVAVNSVRDLAAAQVMRGELDVEQFMSVTDVSGALIHTVDFSDAIQLSGPSELP
jgi:hypothetical protein